jgi:hypothetical protein
MLNHEFSEFSKSPWVGATKNESWIVIVTKAYAMAGTREMSLERLYSIIEQHPKAASRRSFARHHVNGVLSRLGATIKLDLGIWQLITERAGMKPLPTRKRRTAKSSPAKE